MLPLSRSDPLLSEFPSFMLDVLEVVDSLAESPKCVATWIGQELEDPGLSCGNQTIWFAKSDGPILSIPTTVRDTVGTRWWSFSSSQAMSGWRIGKNHNKSKGLKWRILDLIDEKKEK
jgi:hypothetical protein